MSAGKGLHGVIPAWRRAKVFDLNIAAIHDLNAPHHTTAERLTIARADAVAGLVEFQMPNLLIVGALEAFIISAGRAMHGRLKRKTASAFTGRLE